MLALGSRLDGLRTMVDLTKREHFAGQALQGFFSGVPFPLVDSGVDDNGEAIELSEMARLCVAAADALIAELGK